MEMTVRKGMWSFTTTGGRGEQRRAEEGERRRKTRGKWLQRCCRFSEHPGQAAWPSANFRHRFWQDV